MGNSPSYKGNPTLYGLRARQVARQEAEYAAAVKALAEAEAEAKETIPEALAEAGVVVPVRRRSSKAEPATSKEQE